LLAERAAFVVGLDLDPAAVTHAVRQYARANLRFVAASGVQIPLVERFDVVVCLETLGHVDNRDGLIREAKRLLKPRGGADRLKLQRQKRFRADTARLHIIRTNS
jgi:2-polyprenyl-3-methyl-5-hydroxy-6-metoxy-1,4-benzoquinol methylase